MNQLTTYQQITTKPQLSSALLLVVTGDMFAWINHIYILAGLVMLVSFLILFRTSGFIVDKEQKKVKRISGYFGLKMGRWYKLPEIKYVSLLRIKQASYSSYGNSVVKNSPKSFGYQVNLIVRVHKEDRVFRLMTTNVDQALEEGKKLGKYLDIKVLDSTSHKRHWIK